jgi:hypothetical protein
MNTVTQTTRPVKPGRTVRLVLSASEVNPFAVVVITVGKVEDFYHVRPIPSDFGVAFAVEKVSDPNGNSYHVCLSDTGGLCDCKGHCHRGTCRHVEALHALRNAGQL